MNITQQIASSVGAAVMSVVLTNEIKSSSVAGPAIAYNTAGSAAQAQTGKPSGFVQGLIDAGHSYAMTFTVGLILVCFTFIPVLLLPRRKVTAAPPEAIDEAAAAAVPF
jgi:hypothetical protein